MISAEERIKENDQNLIDALNFREPKKVPVGIEAITWPFAYTGGTYKEVMENPRLAAENYLKYLDDIKIDYVWLYGGTSKPVKAWQTLGAKQFYLANDGTTIAHAQVNSDAMRADEYDEFIKDPYYYLDEILVKRRVPAFNKPKDEAYSLLIAALKEFRTVEQMNAMIREGMADKGITNICKDGPAYNIPLDLIFDKVRGVKYASIDLRRRHDIIKAACDRISEIDIANMNKRPSDYEGRNGLFCGLTVYHAACFLSLKQYNEFFVPYFTQAMKPFLEQGVRMFLKGEGEFLNKLHTFRNFPKGSMVILLESDDPFECYKEIGDWAILATGIKSDLLRYGSKQECIDYVKKCYDTFAPGGGFIFMNERSLLGPRDAKIENVIAVYEFANEYGKKR